MPMKSRISRCPFARSVMCLFLWLEGSPLTEQWGNILIVTVALTRLSRNVR